MLAAWLAGCPQDLDSVSEVDTAVGVRRPDGLELTSTTLVPAGATWRYWDRGSVGDGWNEVVFDDTAWPSGPAQLGYGDGDEATVVSFGGSSANKHITTWFRHTFEVADPDAFSSLTLSLLRDDGAVVWLNGVEVVRSNLPAGAITPSTTASTTVGGSAEDTFQLFTVPQLLEGTNVVAVEIHQSSGGSSDISFDLALTGGVAEPPPPPGAIRFAVIGDYGVDEPQEGDVAALVGSWNPDFVLTGGDNNYDGGTEALIDDHIGKYYQQYIGDYQGTWGPGSPANRFWPSLGNHDWDTPGATPYLDYFTLPGNERYYDFVEGPVHFFAIDSDSDEPDGATATSAQAAWLQAALAASTSPWNVVYFHHCPYSSSDSGDQTTRMRWPFAAWGADLVLSAHHHAYERLQIGDLPYIVNGLGGAGIEGFGPPVPGSVVRFDGDWGALRVDATDAGLQLRFVTRAGVVVDTFELGSGGDPITTSFQQGVSPTASYAGTTDATRTRARRTPTWGAPSAAARTETPARERTSPASCGGTCRPSRRAAR